MVKVYCSECKKLIYINADRIDHQLRILPQQEYCLCNRCMIESYKKHKSPLEDKYMQRLREGSKIIEIFINKQLNSQMRRFSQLIEDIINQEDCLQNFVTISTNKIQQELQTYTSGLIQRQTQALIEILQTQQKNNQDLKSAALEYFGKLKESFKTLSIQSHFSPNLINLDFQTDYNIAVYHLNKNKYFSSQEVQGIEKIMQTKINLLEDRHHQISGLIAQGEQILAQYAEKHKRQNGNKPNQSNEKQSNRTEEEKEKSCKAISDAQEGSDGFSLLNDSKYVCKSEYEYVECPSKSQISSQLKKQSRFIHDYEAQDW